MKAAPGVVVEVGFDARGIHAVSEWWARQVLQHGDSEAYDYLRAVAAVTPEYLPAYVRAFVRDCETNGIPKGWANG